jgi:rhodanese-related sulfurtransferase
MVRRQQDRRARHATSPSGSVVPFARLGDAKTRDLTYPGLVKVIALLSAACALCLPLSGCKSDAAKVTDAAAGDVSAQRDSAQPEVAPDGIGASGDVAPSPADTASKPEVSAPDAASETLADGEAADGPGKDTATTVDLAQDAVADALADLRQPGMDLATDLPAVADAGCTGWTALKRLSPAEVSDLLATTDPIVINVHIPYAGDIPGTDTSIPYNNVDAIEAYLNHDHCADVLLICLSGGMSQSAGNELIKRGYLRVRDLNGGMQAWQAAGYPLLKDGGS